MSRRSQRWSATHNLCCIGFEVDFKLAESASSNNGIAWPATAELTETLGDELLVHVASGEHRYQVSLDPHTRPALDGELLLVPEMSRAHIFDGKSEKNLTMPVEVKST